MSIIKFKADLLILPISDHKLKLIENPIITVKTIRRKSIILDISNKGQPNVHFKNGIIIPPFIDLHFHWHQDLISTKDKGDLLAWLKKQVFPQEEKYKNTNFAKKDALRFSKKLLQVGTLGGGCFSSNFRKATEFAFNYFQGDFFIGNTLMDQNVSKALISSHEKIIEDTKYLADKYPSGFALTPRFAISTSPELLAKLNVKNQHYKFIQTHLAENIEEVILTNKLYNKNYAEVYQKMGLLSPKTILAHAIYLSKEEWATLKKYDVILAHCPTSNAPTKELGLDSGLFNYKTADNYKIRWGLASDIGGGPYLSMFDVITSFAKHQKTTLTHGLYRATVNNHKLLDLPPPLTVGSLANFLIVPFYKYRSGEDLLRKIVAPGLKNRKMFNNLVTATIYNGKIYDNKNKIS